MAESTGGAADTAVEVEPEAPASWPTGTFSTHMAPDGAFVIVVEPGVYHQRIAEMLIRLPPPAGWLLNGRVELRFTSPPTPGDTARQLDEVRS